MSKKRATQPTSIDFAILGLVYQEPRTGYGIRMVFETTALGNYSSSPGTIYPALKRLSKLGLIESLPQEEGRKNIFHLTESGKKTLQTWLTQPLVQKDIEKKKEELFLRFAFMDDLVSPSQKIIFLQSFHDLLQDYIQQLEAYHQMAFEQLPLHGRLAFEHGIATYKTSLNWCKETLHYFKKKKNNGS